MPATVIVAVAGELAANPGPFQMVVELGLLNFVFMRKDGAKHVKIAGEKLLIIGVVVNCKTVMSVLVLQATLVAVAT